MLREPRRAASTRRLNKTEKKSTRCEGASPVIHSHTVDAIFHRLEGNRLPIPSSNRWRNEEAGISATRRTRYIYGPSTGCSYRTIPRYSNQLAGLNLMVPQEVSSKHCFACSAQKMRRDWGRGEAYQRPVAFEIIASTFIKLPPPHFPGRWHRYVASGVVDSRLEPSRVSLVNIDCSRRLKCRGPCGRPLDG